MKNLSCLVFPRTHGVSPALHSPIRMVLCYKHLAERRVEQEVRSLEETHRACQDCLEDDDDIQIIETIEEVDVIEEIDDYNDDDFEEDYE